MTKPTVGQDDKASITAPTAPSQHHSKLHQNSTQSSVKTALKTPSEHYLNPFRTPPRTLWNFTQNTIRPPSDYQTTTKNSIFRPPKPHQKKRPELRQNLSAGFCGQTQEDWCCSSLLTQPVGAWVWEIRTVFCGERDALCCDFW